ncbi:hypothetical protein TSUD_65230 [Trifolium subterraneum]|uniref:Uncharacterized protein n=1 Tax=Trifolium subterraneum TaxID=3900 RepID=A0A2Z6NIF2_TRISU|nr:hypothetical protein TSUD_65230 [Trifolium subterraneum]
MSPSASIATCVLPMRAAPASFFILHGYCSSATSPIPARSRIVHSSSSSLPLLRSSVTVCGSSSSTSASFSSSFSAFSQILALRKTQR